jgi:hypothetical protein
MNDSFGIASGAIAVTAELKVLAQIRMIIDFTVENDPNTRVFIAERLVTGLDVNNAEAAHRQSYVLFDKETIVVGTAVDDLLVHSLQQVMIHSPAPVGIENAADSAHDYTPIPVGSLLCIPISASAHTRSSGCSSAMRSGSDEKISTLAAELTISAYFTRWPQLSTRRPPVST